MPRVCPSRAPLRAPCDPRSWASPKHRNAGHVEGGRGPRCVFRMSPAAAMCDALSGRGEAGCGLSRGSCAFRIRPTDRADRYPCPVTLAGAASAPARDHGATSPRWLDVSGRSLPLQGTRTAAPVSLPERSLASAALASLKGIVSTCILSGVLAASSRNSTASRRVRLATDCSRRSPHRIE